MWWTAAVAGTSNDEMVALWNGETSSAWVTNPERYDVMLHPFTEMVLGAAALRPGERVLDVGCGVGALAFDAAEQVGAEGEVLGVDVSAPMLALAAERAAHAEAPVRFLEADAQVTGFASSFDVVVSRFGVMFFADPVAAFANLSAATTPGGRLAFVCWQAAPSNEWVLTALMAMAPHVGPPQLPPPGSPGPFAFADADATRAILEEAGWTDVDLEPRTTSMQIGGGGLDEAVAFFRDDTFGRMLLGAAPAEQVEAALASLREALTPHLDDGCVRLTAAVWVVTASKPG